MHGIYGRELLLVEGGKAGQLGDIVPCSAEEESKGGDKVNAPIEEEATLILGNLAPCTKSRAS